MSLTKPHIPKVKRYTPEQLDALELSTFIKVGQQLAEGGGYIPTEAWEKVYMQTVPTVPKEPCVVRLIDGVPHALLEWRDDNLYRGYCFAGSYQRWNEDPKNTIERVFETQIGGLKLTRAIFIGEYTFRPGDECSVRPDEWWDVPNLQVSALYLCLAKGEPKRGVFYPIDNPPESTLNHHLFFLDRIRAFVIRNQWMKSKGIYLDCLEQAPSRRWLSVKIKLDNPYDPQSSLPWWGLDPPHTTLFTRSYHRTLKEALAFLKSRKDNGEDDWVIFDDNGQFITGIIP